MFDILVASLLRTSAKYTSHSRFFRFRHPEIIFFLHRNLARYILAAKTFILRQPTRRIAIRFLLVGWPVHCGKIQGVSRNLKSDITAEILRPFLPGVRKCHDMINLNFLTNLFAARKTHPSSGVRFIKTARNYIALLVGLRRLTEIPLQDTLSQVAAIDFWPILIKFCSFVTSLWRAALNFETR